MLPTVPEESDQSNEALALTLDSSLYVESLVGDSISSGTESELLKFSDCSLKLRKPIVIITPGLPDIEVTSLSDLLEMEAAAKPVMENATDGAGATSSHDVDAAKQVKEEFKDAGKECQETVSENKNRKDSESGRSGGEEDRRNGSNRRMRNNRNFPRKQREKKWWVCPDPSCRTRNSVDNSACNNCGMVQEKRGPGVGGRHPYARNWEKTRVTGLLMTHVSSPTTLYMQTTQQQHDYARLRNCMAQTYASTSYRPSLVAPKMLLGVQQGEGFERVRTEERRDMETGDGDAAATVTEVPADAPTDVKQEPAKEGSSLASPQKQSTGSVSSSPPRSPLHSPSPTSEWRVQLVDRGSWTWVKEEALNFLLAGLSDLAPLAAKYTLNELRLKRDATEEQVEESRQWLEDQLKDGPVDGDVYKQNRDNATVLYVDLISGETLLNRSICELGIVEPKMNLKWLKNSRVSTSSVEDAPRVEQQGEEHSDQEQRGADSASPSGDAEPKQQQPQTRDDDRRSSSTRSGARSSDRTTTTTTTTTTTSVGGTGDPGPFTQPSDTAVPDSNGATGRRGGGGGYWSQRRANQTRTPQQRLPPLHDWAVLCFDQRTAHNGLRILCEMVERVGKENRVSISSADSIRLENCEDSAMVTVLADVIATHPRLLLLLCVLPHHVQDYSGLERTGRSLGVCVVCVRGDSLSDPNTNTATRLLKDLQTALLNSPAIMPSQFSAPEQGYGTAATNGGGNAGRRRRDNRGRRNQARQRGRSPTQQSLSTDDSPSDPRLQAVIGAASQGIALLQKLSLQSGGGQLSESSLSPGMKSLLQSPSAHQDIAKALESLDDLQGSYKQARSYTHEAFQAAGSFFSHLSNAIAPPAVAE